jgi:formylglycine-generating enzyme required for sulfatase activity
MCTYTTDIGPRENFPLNCLIAEEAREFCAFEGGRFMREVEWEYLATNGMNGVRKTPTPWGNDDGASCAGLIVARDESGPAARCKGLGGGPAPVDAVEIADVAARDKNMLGVVGLIGNLSELVDDGAASYLSRCWLTSPLDAMGCDPTRATRGGMTRGDSWQDITVSPALRAVATDLKQGGQGSPTVGFRCVYEAPQ